MPPLQKIPHLCLDFLVLPQTTFLIDERLNFVALQKERIDRPDGVTERSTHRKYQKSKQSDTGGE